MSDIGLDINKILHPEEGAAVKEDFIVDSLEKVDWACGKAGLAMHRIADRTALVKKYKSELDKWLLEQNHPDEQTINYMTGVTREFATAEIEKQGKKRSIAVPCGTVGLRKGSVSVDIQDEKKALAYCREHAPSAIKESLLKPELKKLEAGDGFTLVTGEEIFYIKPSGIIPG